MKAAFAEAREECAPPDAYASRLGVSAKVITRSNVVKATTNGQRVGSEMLDRPMASELASAMAVRRRLHGVAPRDDLRAHAHARRVDVRGRTLLAGLGKRGLHGGVVPRELADAEPPGFVVRKTQVVLARDQIVSSIAMSERAVARAATRSYGVSPSRGDGRACADPRTASPCGCARASRVGSSAPCNSSRTSSPP